MENSIPSTATIASPPLNPEPLSDSELANDFWFVVVKLRHHMRAIMDLDRSLSSLGLNGRTYSALSLACTDIGPSQREVAGFLTLDARQVVYVLDELEKLELIDRRTHPKDRRLNAIYPTERGKELYTQARTIVQRREDQALRELTLSERGLILEKLKKSYAK